MSAGQSVGTAFFCLFDLEARGLSALIGGNRCGGDSRGYLEWVQVVLAHRATQRPSGCMNVERVKYIIWAADMPRAIAFYRDVLGATVSRTSDVISEIELCGAVIGIHGGGEGKRTWTGMSFQVPDVVDGAREVVAGGGALSREPQEEDGEPPHLAMCVDPEGNEFMLTRKRG